METVILTPASYEAVRNSRTLAKTKSYTPIGHGELIDYVRERIDKLGLKIVNESYDHNKGCKQMFGQMAISNNDSDMHMAIGFRNSIDKSLPVGFVAGTQIIVCKNLMLEGDVKQVRRHTSNIKLDLDNKFNIILEEIDGVFQSIAHQNIKMKETPISQKRAEQVFGHIMMRRQDMSTIQQTTQAIELFKNPIHNFGNETVWGLCNAFTEAFKGAHPAIAPNNFLKLNKFLKNEFQLN